MFLHFCVFSFLNLQLQTPGRRVALAMVALHSFALPTATHAPSTLLHSYSKSLNMQRKVTPRLFFKITFLSKKVYLIVNISIWIYLQHFTVCVSHFYHSIQNCKITFPGNSLQQCTPIHCQWSASSASVIWASPGCTWTI